MSFHEVLLPDELAYGAEFGPEYRTTLVMTASGGEQRVAQWARPRRRGTVGYSVRTGEQMQELRAFYYARQGRAFGFRFSDNSDRFADHEPLVNTGGATLQLQKTYTDAGGYVTTRTITKPSQAGPFTLYKDGAAMTGGYALNVNTGLVALTVAAPGSVFTWSGQFDVAVRFDGDWMGEVRDDFDIRHWDGIAIVEILL